MPLVSVIIPVYNVEKYLKQCIDSVINQTLKDIEIICVDDGSTDNSLNILKEYALKDERIVIIRQKNKHAGVARNQGLKIAKGKYIHFLDSDDWIEHYAYEKLCNIMKNSNYPDIIKFRAYSFNNITGEIESSAYLDAKGVDEKYFENFLNIYNNPINTSKLPDSPWSGFYCREFLIKNKIYFDDFVCVNDVGFFYRCIINAKSIYLSSEKLVYYRENRSNSLIDKRAQNFNCQTALYGIVKKNSRHLTPEIRNILIERIIEVTLNWYKKCIKNYNLADKNYKKIKREMRKFLKDTANEKLSEQNQKKYNKIYKALKKEQTDKKKRFINNIFSVKNKGTHKVFCIFGLKVKFKK